MSDTDHIAANRSYGGDASNLQRQQDLLDDPLTERVETALAELHGPTCSFVKSKRIAAHLGLEPTRSTHRQIGKRLEALADDGRPIVEKWSPGNGQTTWRIRSEHL